MSLAFAVVSIVLLVAVFATGAFVGYLAIGGSSKAARNRKASKIVSVSSNALPLDEFRGLIQRLENRMLEHEQRTAANPNDSAKPADKPLKVDLSTALPDVERQLRELVNEIRRAHEAFSGGGAAGGGSSAAGGARASEGAASSANPEGVAASEEDASTEERRSRIRHSFKCRQWVAPYNGCRIPGAEEFLYVECNDISSVGISFFMDSDPDCQMVVIRLASPRGPKFLTARVRRVTPVTEAKPENGAYTIGCQFLGTIHFDALPPRLNNSILHREEQVLLEGLPKRAAALASTSG